MSATLAHLPPPPLCAAHLTDTRARYTSLCALSRTSCALHGREWRALQGMSTHRSVPLALSGLPPAAFDLHMLTLCSSGPSSCYRTTAAHRGHDLDQVQCAYNGGSCSEQDQTVTGQSVFSIRHAFVSARPSGVGCPTGPPVSAPAQSAQSRCAPRPRLLTAQRVCAGHSFTTWVNVQSR